MQSDVLNEQQQQQQQQQLSNDSDCSTSLSTTTLIYSGLKLQAKPIVPTISMPGVTSSLSIVKKLSIPDSHLDTRHTSTSTTTNSTATTPSSIRLITPTGKSSPPFQITDKTTATTNGTFSTSKTYILNPQQNSTTTVTKSTNSSATSSLLTLIPPGTTSPKIQTLNSVTISSTNDTSTTDNKSTHNNSNQSVFLSKNRVTLVQPLITNTNSSNNNINSSKLVTTNNNFWHHSQPQSNTTQTTKIFSIPTAKVLSRPVQLIPTTSEHHPHITHIQTVKSEKSDAFPISMHIGLSSPTTTDNPIKHFDTSTHPAYIHMQLLPTSNVDSINTSQQQLQFTLPATHLYSSPSSLLISTAQRSMDHNNNHQTPNITTPIIREMQTEEKNQDSILNQNFHSTKTSTKNRARLPLQPSTQQSSSALTTSSTSITPSSSSTTIRQPKKHKLNEDEQISCSEPAKKLAHYEQFVHSRHRSISKLTIENTTPANPLETITFNKKKRTSSQTFNPTLPSRKRRHHNPNKLNAMNSTHSNTQLSTIEQIDDELVKRLSQDFVYTDHHTGLRWIATKTRSKSINNLVSRFSWKPKINHYEKYSDIIRTNPKRIVPVKTVDTIRQQLNEPWASWRIDRLTAYLSDLTHDEQLTINELNELTQTLDVNDQSIRTTIDDLIQSNIQRHRCFSEQLTQISTVLVSLLQHGNLVRDLSKCSTTKRTKDR